MRIAVAGKGGAGKTTIAATAARLAARAGRSVVAIDADTNPNLHVALAGAGAATTSPGFLPASLVSRRFDGPALVEAVETVLARHGVVAPDGVQLVRMGAPAHPDEGCLCSAHATASALLADLGDRPDVVTILDLEASPEHLSRGTARHADVLVLVAEPYFRSLEAVRLQSSLAAETAIPHVVAVANKTRSRDDHDAVAAYCARHDIGLVGTIPWSEDVLAADLASEPLLDHAPRSEAVSGIASITDRLLELAARPSVGVDS